MEMIRSYAKKLRPSREDELMLTAALHPSVPRALEAWRVWTETADIDRLYEASQRLIPLLYHRLNSLGIEHGLMDRFKGIYRRSWYRNQMNFHRALPVLKAFADAGIDPLVLKGGAVSQLYYPQPGLRPMNDFDLLVPLRQTDRALEILRALGYEPIERRWEQLDGEYRFLRHGHGFLHRENGHEFDLHWHLMPESCSPDIDEVLWRYRQSVRIGEMTVGTLDATFHLMHTCAHGFRWNELAPVRWVADAVKIMEKETIDWQRLFAETRRRKIVLPVALALEYLWREFAAPVPAEVLARFTSFPFEKVERLGAVVNQEYYDAGSRFRRPFAWFRYECLRYAQAKYGSDTACLTHPWMLPRFIRGHWGLDSAAEVPGEVLRRGGAKLKRLAGSA